MLNIITEINRKKWSDFVISHACGNIFQTPQIFDVYANLSKWKPVVLAAVDDEDNISGILLAVVQRELNGAFAKFTSRAIIWGGPLVAGPDKDRAAVVLLEGLDKILKKEVIYIQVRNLYDASASEIYFKNHGYEHEGHLNFLIDLEMGEQCLWKKVYPARRNQIKSAEKKGVTVRTVSSEIDIEESYNILKEVYKRINIPFANKELFDGIYKLLFPKGMANVFLATYNNKIIGVLYLLIYKEYLYTWYAGSLSNYYNQQPNAILYWEAIKWGFQNGYKVFDFGGAGSPHRIYGVRRFKEEFGGKLVNYGRFQKTYRPYAFAAINAGLKLWQKI